MCCYSLLFLFFLNCWFWTSFERVRCIISQETKRKRENWDKFKLSRNPEPDNANIWTKIFVTNLWVALECVLISSNMIYVSWNETSSRKISNKKRENRKQPLANNDEEFKNQTTWARQLSFDVSPYRNLIFLPSSTSRQSW